MSMQHTPGPWRWELNAKHRTINLCGGKNPYDLTVMGFARWGMNGAQPLFLDPTRPEHMVLEPAEKFSEVVPGREHHAHWFKTVNTPDAKLIAAAPDLLEAAKEALRLLNAMEASDGSLYPRTRGILNKSIEKATL